MPLSRSRTVSRGALNAMRRALPNARLSIVYGAGHSLPLSLPT